MNKFPVNLTGKKGKALVLGAFLLFPLASCGGNSTSSETTTVPGVSSQSEITSAIESSSIVTSEEEKHFSYHFTEGVDNDQGLSYEIFVPAFADSDGNGVGDFKGIAEKADYLESMGVSRVWLLPIHPTSSYHGYDVNDYYAVNAKFGTMDDFQEMLGTLKEHGIEVVIDMVLNHSGKNNPWFPQAVEDFINGNINDDSKADWYSLSEEKKAGYAEYHGVYYECNFSDSMPEFNWDSPGFRAEVENILKFWLDKGVSGFRLDAVLYYYYNVHNKNTDACRYLRECVADEYPDCYFVGEGWTSNSILLNDYYPSTLGSFFDFDHSVASDNTFVTTAKGLTSGTRFSTTMASFVNGVKEVDENSFPSFFMANHDTDRTSQFLFKEHWQKLAASLIYLMPGTPYIYYGEEINLYGTRGEEQTDGMRRLPMVWKMENDEYRCNVPDNAVKKIAEKIAWCESGATDQEAVSDSVVNHYKKVGNVRNRLKGIVNATMEAISHEDIRNLVDYKLFADDTYRILTNTGADPIEVEVEGNLFDYIETMGELPTLSDGKLTIPAYSTAILLLK